ncbi:MAG: hypothetical protein KTR31_36920 [Myxococcales bacterium]|nr:hypothetical protein [Myxococcales bacterium]
MTDAQGEANPTADPQDEAALRAILRHRTDPLVALREGLKLAARTVEVGLPTALLFGVLGGLVGHQVISWAGSIREMDAESRSLGLQLSLVVGIFLLAYAGIQYTKRETASLVSWAPALFALPALLFAFAFQLAGGGQAMQGIEVFVQVLPLFAWTLIWWTFAGAAASIAWVRSGHAALTGETVTTAEVVAEVQRRTLEVAAPHGGRTQAVFVGQQVILPGIFYALQLAFTDMIAVLDPGRSALRRSGQLTWGMRGRLFRLFLVYFLVWQVAIFGVFVAIDGAPDGLGGRFMELLMNPTAPSMGAMVAMETLSALLSWVLTLSLLVLYRERLTQVDAKRALRALKDAEKTSA